MSANNYAENLNTASITGEVFSASLRGEVSSDGLLGGVKIGGLNVNKYPDIPIATTRRFGGIIVGDHLSVTEEGRVSVVMSDTLSSDNTNPVSAATVYTEVGNINALLQSI